MTTITCDDLQILVADAGLPDTTSEAIVDTAIDMLNTFGANLSNLTGVAGAKTGTYTSAEGGAIMPLAVQVYITMYKSAGASSTAIGIGALQTSSSSSTGGQQSALLDYAKMLAGRLAARQFRRT